MNNTNNSSQEAYKDLAKLLDFIEKDNKKHNGNDIYISNINVSKILEIGIENIQLKLKTFYENFNVGDIKEKTLEAINAFKKVSEDGNSFMKSLKEFSEMPQSIKTVNAIYEKGEVFTVNKTTKQLFDILKGLNESLSNQEFKNKNLGE